MHIKKVLIKHIDNNKWRKVDSILLDAKGKVFFGRAVVKVSGYSGSVSLDTLISIVTREAKKRCVAGKFHIKKRLSGINITKKLEDLCAVTDEKLKQSSSLIKGVNSRRSYFKRLPLKSGDTVKYFKAYSDVEYRLQFHQEDYPDADDNIERTLQIKRYIVTERAIRDFITEYDRIKASTPSFMRKIFF